MSKKEELLALSDRVEELDGPSREVDILIGIAIEWKHRHAPCSMPEWANLMSMTEMVRDAESHQSILKELPRCTASLGAAIQLVPSHMVVNMGNDGRCWSHVWHDTNDYNGVPHDSAAASLALAVTASALRARAALEDA